MTDEQFTKLMAMLAELSVQIDHQNDLLQQIVDKPTGGGYYNRKNYVAEVRQTDDGHIFLKINPVFIDRQFNLDKTLDRKKTIMAMVNERLPYEQPVTVEVIKKKKESKNGKTYTEYYYKYPVDPKVTAAFKSMYEIELEGKNGYIKNADELKEFDE